MPKFLLLIILMVCLLSAGCDKHVTPTPAAASYNYTHALQIGDKTLMVEAAETQANMEQGLSDRTSMAANQGMLFDFGNDAAVEQAFWMKDMDFNLDFIWIYKNKIVGITPDVPKPVNCQKPALSGVEGLIVNCTASLPYYYPPSPVNWVLEVNAGWAEKNNIKVGDEAKLIDKIDQN